MIPAVSMGPLAQIRPVALVAALLAAVVAGLAFLAARAEARRQSSLPGSCILFDAECAFFYIAAWNSVWSVAMALQPRWFIDDYVQAFLGSFVFWIGLYLGLMIFLAQRLAHARGRHPMQLARARTQPLRPSPAPPPHGGAACSPPNSPARAVSSGS